jgi:hypothetical protein
MRPVAGFPVPQKNWIACHPGFFAPVQSSRAFSAVCAQHDKAESTLFSPAKTFSSPLQ